MQQWGHENSTTDTSMVVPHAVYLGPQLTGVVDGFSVVLF